MRFDLTDRDINYNDPVIIGGRRDQPEEQIRQRCGITANHDRIDIEDWYKAMTFRELPTILIRCSAR